MYVSTCFYSLTQACRHRLFWVMCVFPIGKTSGEYVLFLPGFLKQTQDMTLRDGGMAVDTPGSPL